MTFANPMAAGTIETQSFAGLASPPAPSSGNLIRGGLAPWQMRRVVAHVEENLTSTVRVADLADITKLSASYFCRAFKSSFGEPPYGYVMRQRIERAKQLMVETRSPLSLIALECGLADQAHLSRLFRRVVGHSPNSWRRGQRG